MAVGVPTLAAMPGAVFTDVPVGELRQVSIAFFYTSGILFIT